MFNKPHSTGSLETDEILLQQGDVFQPFEISFLKKGGGTIKERKAPQTTATLNSMAGATQHDK